jgi:hypothetical protein
MCRSFCGRAATLAFTVLARPLLATRAGDYVLVTSRPRKCSLRVMCVAANSDYFCNTRKLTSADLRHRFSPPAPAPRWPSSCSALIHKHYLNSKPLNETASLA